MAQDKGTKRSKTPVGMKLPSSEQRFRPFVPLQTPAGQWEVLRSVSVLFIINHYGGSITVCTVLLTVASAGPLEEWWPDIHFTGEEVEAVKGEVMCLSHRDSK